MKLTASEFISKAEGLKSSEMNVRQRLESIRSHRQSVQSAIATQQYRLQSLYLELEALESKESGDDEDGEGTDNSAEIAAVMAEISSTQESIEEYEQQDAELRSEEMEANSELRSIELQEQETLAEIQDSAARTNQNIALISSFGGDYANVSAQAAGSFQHNLGQLSQAAQILGGNVATGASGAGGGSSKGGSISGGGSSGGTGSGRNFYEAANNQRKTDVSSSGSMGAKGAAASSTGRNGKDLYGSASTSGEEERPKKNGGFGKRPGSSSKQTPLEALANYMNEHHYGRDDFAIYSQDPEWRVLQKAAYPDYNMPSMDPQTAFRLLNQYMASNNYGLDDYAIYSKDPIWQELHGYAYPDFSKSVTRPDKGNASKEYASVINSLTSTHVEHRNIELFGRSRTTEEIVNRLGGGDKTEGSCSSLAFAYVGNKAGYDVLDFRDGESRSFFSSNDSIQMIADLPNVDSKIIHGRDDIKCANSLLNTMVSGKEYYLATGQHASVVRKVDGHFEYLELQSAWDNGWHRLDDNILRRRFGCEHSNWSEYPNFLIDIDSLARSHEFLDILGYINTAESDQRKGVSGHVR